MKKLLVVSALCSAVFLAFVVDPRLPMARFGVVFKVASVLLLLAVGALASPRKLLVFALGFSAFGDWVLDIRQLGSWGPVQLFMVGLISFLIAHLCYLVMFFRFGGKQVSALRKLACIALIVCAALISSALWPTLAEMRIPVLAYSVVLTLMAVSAQLSRFGPGVAIGALFFFASDSMLAISLFGHSFPGSRAMVWITYYATQLFITLGVVRAAVAKPAIVAVTPGK